MPSKLIFLDLDGTIIDHKTNSVQNSTKLAIKKAQENNHKIVIATGRPPCLFYGIDKILDIDSYIAGNGRYVLLEGKTIYSDFIDANIVKEFVDDMHSKNLDVAFETIDEYIMLRRNDRVVFDFSKHFNLKTPNINRDFDNFDHVLQMVLFAEDFDIDYFSKHYPNLDIHRACPYGFDINAKGGMKDIGVKKVIEALGFSKENTVAIGDGYNDVTMFHEVGIGVAMGNACKPLKEMATFVTTSSNQDGVYNAFKRLNLI